MVAVLNVHQHHHIMIKGSIQQEMLPFVFYS